MPNHDNRFIDRFVQAKEQAETENETEKKDQADSSGLEPAIVIHNNPAHLTNPQFLFKSSHIIQYSTGCQNSLQ